MPYRLILTPAAEADLHSIHAWFEEQSPGMGDEILARIEKTFDLLRLFPAMDAIERPGIRLAPVTKSKYIVAYRLIRRTIRVVADYHVHRDDTTFFERN